MNTYAKIIPVDSVNPQPERIRRAADLILGGRVVTIPTTGLYGLAADATNPAAVQSVFRIKNRQPDQPLLILVKDLVVLNEQVRCIPPEARVLMNAFWPGKITLVFQASANLCPELTAGTGKIGIRIPAHPVTAALVQTLDIPITGTSANLSQAKGVARIADMDPQVLGASELVLDAGSLEGGAGSTVVDVSVSPSVVLREGAVSVKAVEKVLAESG